MILLLSEHFSGRGQQSSSSSTLAHAFVDLESIGKHWVDLHGPHDHQSHCRGQAARPARLVRASKEAGREYRKHFRQLQTLAAEHTALNTAETARRIGARSPSSIKSLKLIRKTSSPTEEDEIEKRYKLSKQQQIALIELASAWANKLPSGRIGPLATRRDRSACCAELDKDRQSRPQKLSSEHAAAVVQLPRWRVLSDTLKSRYRPEPTRWARAARFLFEYLKRK